MLHVVRHNSLSVWVPCAAHSLNMVIKNAAEWCFEETQFFDFVEKGTVRDAE